MTCPGVLPILCCCFSFGSSQLFADTLLFDSHAVLELSIPLDFKTLCHPREEPDCDYTPTVMEYVDEHGVNQSLPIGIMIRGGWRSLTKNCSAPLLFIRFDEAETADTPFQGQSVLPLTTHCGQGLSIRAHRERLSRNTWEQYLLREYLAHRLYNVITDVSLNARLVHMTYPNPEKPGREISNYAFFTEHFESVAARNGFDLPERGSFDYDKLALNAAVQVALFQFMIGNTDWSISRERNIVLLQRPDGALLPLPYDFDMSGLVNAHYAGPAPGLPISEVRDRHYLGYCRPEADLEPVIDQYLASQESLLSMVDSIPPLSKKSRKSSRKFLQEFFRILQSDEARSEKIMNRCLAWPPDPTNDPSNLD